MTLNTQPNCQKLLNSHQKAIEYAWNLVTEGDLLAGKAILDQTLKTISCIKSEINTQLLSDTKDALLQRIDAIYAEITARRTARIENRRRTSGKDLHMSNLVPEKTVI